MHGIKLFKEDILNSIYERAMYVMYVISSESNVLGSSKKQN